MNKYNDLLHRIGWSKSFAARYLGVSRRTVQHWCEGDSENRSALKCLKLIAKLLDV